MELNGTITENRVDLGGTITKTRTLSGALAPTGGSAGPVVVTRGTGANSLIEVHTTSPNIASEASSVAIGGGNQSIASGAVTIGTNNVASAQNAVAIGSKLIEADPNTASGTAATALGLSCLSSGYGSVAVGYNTTASNTGSFSSGYQTTSSGQASMTAGYLSTASGTTSAAIGQEATASASAAVAMGRETTASGAASTALGRGTTASASQALAAGRDTKAEAVASTALGYGTDATGARSLVAGAYNEPDANAVDTTHGSGARKYLMIIGNGTADNARSNAATLDWDGNAVFAGKATVGAAPTADMDVATKKYVDDHGGSVTVDTALSTTSTNPVQNKVITAALATKADQAGIQQVIEDEVDDWLSVQAPSIGTLSYAAKQALLACFRHVAWIDDQGQSYYNALESELFPDATLASISAVFTQSSAVIYDTDSLDTLRQYLVVTATYSDSTTATVTDYALSGTLTAGTSTITVNYGGKTTTFSVAVTAWDISWDYTEGLPENNGFTKTYTNGTANMTSNGLECSGSSLAWTPNNEQTATTTIFETVFIPEILSSQNSANGNGFKLAVFNGSRAMTVGVNSQGVCYYNAARSGYSVATSNISTNTEYLLRIETGQSEGKIYLDGELVSTVALASTSTTNSRVFGAASAGSGKTLIKAIRYDYVT